MKNNITRQASLFAYSSNEFANRMYHFIKRPSTAVIASYGINTKEVLKHVLHAKKIYKQYYITLFLPSILFWISLLISFFKSNTSFLAASAIIYVFIFLIIYWFIH